MWVQAVGIALVILSEAFAGFAAGALLLGIGTAMVYPTLLAAIGDVAHPSWRGSAVGLYRFWRDSGYVAGALLAGTLADLFGMRVAIAAVGCLTITSGIVAAVRMPETLSRIAPPKPAVSG